MWGTWLSLARTMTEYDAATFLADGQHMINNLVTAMAVLMISAVIVSAVVVVLLFWSRTTVAAWLALAGLLLMIAVMAITLVVEVPIDNSIANWTEATLPSDWRRARWAAFHTLRTFLSLGAVAAALLRRSQRGHPTSRHALPARHAAPLPGQRGAKYRPPAPECCVRGPSTRWTTASTRAPRERKCP
jgi:uncharacterized membrane protein